LEYPVENLLAEPPGGVAVEPADHALGRSRGGLTTKLHLGCEQGQKPLSIVLTAGQWANRRYVRRRGIKATIPSKADQDANRRKLGSPRGC